jgi:predicted nucleic acid-binding protein
MPGSFFDTNVLLYLASNDPKKADVAERLVAQGGAVSVQVLNEITNVARRKMRLSWTETHDLLELVRSLLMVTPITVETHERGLSLAERYGFSFQDAMIVAAALLAEAGTLWSEDMQHEMAIDDGLRICNPFRTA